MMSSGRAIGGSGGVSSVARAMAILECFEEAEYLGVTQIAARIGTAKSTAARLLNTLRRAGVVEQDPESGRYHLGVRLYEWGQLTASRHDLRAAARPILRDLCTELDLTAALVVPTADGVVHLDRAEPRTAVDFWARHGSAFSPRGAGGIVISALRQGVCSGRVPSGSDGLSSSIARARDTGYALEFEQVIKSTASLAAPIRRFGGAEAAVALIGDQRVYRSRSTLAELVARSMRAARQIETRRRRAGEK